MRTKGLQLEKTRAEPQQQLHGIMMKSKASSIARSFFFLLWSLNRFSHENMASQDGQHWNWKRQKAFCLKLGAVYYLPSFWWCLFSDFMAAWMSSWLKMSLWKQQWTNPLGNTKMLLHRTHSLPRLLWYSVLYVHCWALGSSFQFSEHKEHKMHEVHQQPSQRFIIDTLVHCALHFLTRCGMFMAWKPSALMH